MSEPGGPTVRKRRLGGELRRLRERAKLDQAAAAAHLECSTSKISRMETGQGIAPKALEVTRLLDLYGVTDEAERAKIMDIRRSASEKGWWEQAEYEEVLASGHGVYVGLEYDARALQVWELGYVPGLLQTRDYARAVHAALPPESVDRLVDVRMQRQRRLTDAHPLELWAVIDESVLGRQVGGPEVMRDQIRSLAAAARQPNITLQVYPARKDVHPGLRGAFSLLEFGPSDPRIGYVDSPSGNTFLEKDRQIRSLVYTMDRLRAGALDPEETAALLDGLLPAAEENT
ncbi:helix-turn-helix domain-containing protein [Streptomyces katrae]|uniref:HTH cro/C1-type domain-containing protein n=1 Tax=Streptomyces katrae TaxID=68223 RepID=A0A0F4JC40_9ACTN|nr:helix-turn-helix transcriptional regulator [Streptomyces katrae]KJY31770.1 hypothetical protein VR44_17525 [Streptomyces katrae]